MITIQRHSGIYTLIAEQHLPISLQDAWTYFSDPRNLPKISPKSMNFKITSPEEDGFYIGQIITYKVDVFKGITSNWVTEITHIENGKSFIDEQRFGPYSMWHHYHLFEEIEGGVKMTDRVSYKVPAGFIGRGMHSAMIKPKLIHIFEYRRDVLEKEFGTMPSSISQTA